MNEPGGAREYHRLTVHDPSGLRPDDPRLVRGYRPLVWHRKPPQFKTYPGLEVTPLPKDIASCDGGQGDVGLLSRLLFLSAGVVRRAEVGGQTMYFRAAGSAGNLSPVEVYVVTGDVPGLAAGVYHYQPVEHGLVRVGDVAAGDSLSLVLTGVPWRTGWKYRERGFRHLYWDAGTMLAHALSVAEEASLRPRVQTGFRDRAVAALVGADGTHELPLVTVALTQPSTLPVDGGGDVPAGHLATDPVEFPLVTEAQRSGELDTQGDVDRWQSAAAQLALEPASTAPPPLGAPLEETILRRGSCRRFDVSRTAPEELLVDAMAWATRPVIGDFTTDGATLLDHYLAVHSVDGVEPGTYRWQAGELQQLWAGFVRDAAAHLCLDQELGGSGAYTAFHCARLDEVLAALGSRGYRAALLEAGVVEGRLHLFAYSHGWAATGLTYYDREVSRAFVTSASPLLVTAVGAPAYRSKPGGLPRRPVSLRRL